MSEVDFNVQRPGKGKKRIVQSEGYYIEAKFAVFQVEKRLFKVPTHIFKKESPRFSEIYGLGSSNKVDSTEKAIEFQHCSNVIVLKDIRGDEFRSLLKILYPLDMSSGISLSKKEWISVLYISTEWSFLHVRQTAIAELDRLMSLTSVEKIMLGRNVSVASWVRTGLEEIVARGGPISDDEGIELDSNDDVITALKLSWIRELRIKGNFSSFTLAAKIEEFFGEELLRLQDKENEYKGQIFQEEKRKEAIEMVRLQRCKAEEEEKMRIEKQKEEEKKLKKEEEKRKNEVARLLEEEKQKIKNEEWEETAMQLKELLSASRAVRNNR